MELKGLRNVNPLLKRHYLIYKIVNKSNGMYYIGQHSTCNINDNYMGSGVYINNAIKEHGQENFIKEILYDFDNFNDMDEKEKELVTEESCYPHNKLSYNLIPGGNGIKLTLSIILKRTESLKTYYANMPEDDRRKLSEKARQLALKREHNKTNIQKQQLISNLKKTWLNKTAKEIQEGVEKWRLSVKKHTLHQKDEITRKRLQTVSNRSDEEKHETKLKRQETIKSRTLEEQENINKNISNGIAKAHKNNPLLAIQHSIRMTGKNNPVYGCKLMSKDGKRKYVKPNEIEEYLNDGYIFGIKNIS